MAVLADADVVDHPPQVDAVVVAPAAVAEGAEKFLALGLRGDAVVEDLQLPVHQHEQVELVEFIVEMAGGGGNEVGAAGRFGGFAEFAVVAGEPNERGDLQRDGHPAAWAAREALPVVGINQRFHLDVARQHEPQEHIAE